MPRPGGRWLFYEGLFQNKIGQRKRAQHDKGGFGKRSRVPRGAGRADPAQNRHSPQRSCRGVRVLGQRAYQRVHAESKVHISPKEDQAQQHRHKGAAAQAGGNHTEKPAEQGRHRQSKKGQQQDKDYNIGTKPGPVKRYGLFPGNQRGYRRHQAKNQSHDPEHEHTAEQDVPGLDGHAEEQVIIPGLIELGFGHEYAPHKHQRKAHQRRHGEIQPIKPRHMKGEGEPSKILQNRKPKATNA